MGCRRSTILYRLTYHIEFSCCRQRNAFSAKPQSQSNFSSCLHPFLSSGLLTFPIKWPKFWSFSFSISPSNEYSGLISFKIDWVDLLAVQGTLKSLLQHHSSKAPILLDLAFFTVQLSHPYKTTGKTIALTIWNELNGLYGMDLNFG